MPVRDPRFQLSFQNLSLQMFSVSQSQRFRSHGEWKFGDFRWIVDVLAENIGRAKIEQPGWGADTITAWRGTVSADDQAEPEGRKIFVKWTRNLSVSHRPSMEKR